MLYSVTIPDSGSGKLFYSNISKFYDSLDQVEKQYLNDIEILVQFYQDHSVRNWYDLVYINRVTGSKSLSLNAIDHSEDFLGLKKHDGYVKGNTHIVSVREKSTKKELDASFLADLIKRCVSMENNLYEHSWKPNQLMIISNLDLMHCRTTISETPDERLLYRRTIFHDYQYKDYLLLGA